PRRHAGPLRHRLPPPSLPPPGDRLHAHRREVHARGAARLLPSLLRAQQHHAGGGGRLRRRRGAAPHRGRVERRAARRAPLAGATLPPERTDAAIDAILDEALRLTREEALPEEIDKAKTIVESDTVYQKETVQGMARKLGFYQTVTGAVGYEDEYQRQVREV